MSLEYIVEKLGYSMSDNIIKRCYEQLVRVMKKQRTETEYTIRIRTIISLAS